MIELVASDLLVVDEYQIGRKGLSAESIFRCMLLKQIEKFSYEQLSFMLSDSQSYRAFARLDHNDLPSKSALNENIRRIKTDTLKTIFVP